MKLVLDALHLAALRHADQRRKGLRAEPYINHLIEVVWLLAVRGDVTDEELLAAAALHDIVEDTETGLAEIGERFGPAVAGLVAAVTDDKSLPKARRKQLQIERMADASDRVRLLKLADHTSNVQSLPEAWPRERQVEYLQWSWQVTAQCFGLNSGLEQEYRARRAAAARTLDLAPPSLGSVRDSPLPGSRTEP